MSDLGPFLPFTTPPFDGERLENLSGLYLRTFERLEALLEELFSLDRDSKQRYDQVVEDIERIESNEGISVTEYPTDDLAEGREKKTDIHDHARYGGFLPGRGQSPDPGAV